MRRTLVLSAVLVLGVCGAWLNGAPQGAQPQPQPFNPANFTGKVTPQPAADIRTSRNHFDPGARTNWHSHTGGQVILIEEGRARMQERGLAVKEFGPGESVRTAPGIVHWHGAPPNVPLTQVALTFGTTNWMEKVSDAEYSRSR